MKAVQDVNTGEKRILERQPRNRIPLNQENVDFIKQAMVGVNLEGTSAKAFANAPFTSGGKTGTAQVFSLKANEKYDAKRVGERFRDHAWFIAFAPAENPKIALAVIVENGGFGAQSAAPIARTAIETYLTAKEEVKP